MTKNEYDDTYSDDSIEIGLLVADDEDELTHQETLDESLVHRRRRLERMLEAKSLSKQLFDYEGDQSIIHCSMDDDFWVAE